MTVVETATPPEDLAPHCPVCGSVELEYDHVEWRDVTGETFQTDIARCLDCGAEEEIA